MVFRFTLPLLLAYAVSGQPQITPACRVQARNFLQPFNDTGIICAAELMQLFSETNTQGFSETQVKCIGEPGLRTCYGLSDPVETTGVNLTDSVNDCSLCAPPPSTNRTGCQDLLDSLAQDIMTSPRACTVPMNADRDSIGSDLSQIVLLRFQLDIKCSGVSFTSPVINGEMATLKQLTQCQCGATVCPPGIYCAENELPVFCPEGYFCPDFGGDKIKCRENHYCPEGSIKEVECRGTTCSEGSSRQWEFVPFLLTMIFVPLLLVAINFSFSRYENWIYRDEDDENEEDGVEMEKIDKMNKNASGLISVPNPSKPSLPNDPSVDTFGSVTESKGLKSNKGSLKNNSVAPPLKTNETPPLRCTLDIKFQNLGLRVPAPKGCCGPKKNVGIPLDDEGMVTRLDSVSGHFETGTLTAVMGPSGSGKSTFLNVLCGKLEHTSGTVWVNGVEAELPQYKQSIGFVPQNDIVESQLLVREALQFSANIRLANKSADEREDVVNSTLKKLGLWHIRNSVVGDEYRRGISGGEKKRVNIGVELVAEPSALFLDEPTTGLDATASLKVAQILRKLAIESKMTICAVIHQPRPLMVNTFDNLLLLLRGGRTAWFGNGVGALSFFKGLGYKLPSGIDFPDFFSDVISGMASCDSKSDAYYEQDVEVRKKNVKALAAKYREFRDKKVSMNNVSDGKQETTIKDQQNDSAVPLFSQFISYFYRGLLLRFIRTNKVITDCIAYLIGGFIISLVFSGEPLLSEGIDPLYGRTCPATSESTCYRPENNAVARFGFYSVMCLGVIATAVATMTFGGERKILYWREASGGASSLAYFLGENLCDIVTMWLYTLFYSAPIQLIVTLRGDFGSWWLLWTMTTFTLNGISYIYSIGLTDLSDALITGVVSAIIFSLFHGFVGGINTAGPFTYAMWSGRAASNIEYNQGYGLSTSIPQFCRDNPSFGSEEGCFRDFDTDELVSYYDFIVPITHRAPDIAVDFAILLAIGLAVRVIAYIILIEKDKDKQK